MQKLTQVKEKMKEEITPCFEWKENENTAYQNLEDTAKTILKGSFLALTACF